MIANDQWFIDNKKKLLAIDSPILPCVQDALKMLDQDDLEIDKVVSCISKDPMLCAKLLMMANSPFYGLPREVSNLNEVIVILGAYKVKSLIITGSIDAWKGSVGDELKKVWVHSLAVACFCESFAKKIDIDEQDAYLIGLLHEVILFKSEELGLELMDSLDEFLGFCMPKLLELWGFPVSLVEGVKRFYLKETQEKDVLPLAHCVANSLLFNHKNMMKLNVIEQSDLGGKDFDFWLTDSNDVVTKIKSLRY